MARGERTEYDPRRRVTRKITYIPNPLAEQENVEQRRMFYGPNQNVSEEESETDSSFMYNTYFDGINDN